ncbi:hypothetical protein JCM10213_002221 [Rhodosporidiobolus nylandii]
MNSSLFDQLNQLTPSPGISPANGPAKDRNDLALSFPCDGTALHAQLEAWTNVAFDFDSPDFGDAALDEPKASSPVEDRSALRYAGAFGGNKAPQLGQFHQQQQQQQSTVSPELTSSVDLSALLGGAQPPASFSADPFAPSSLTSGSLVDPSLSLPAFGAPAPSFPSFFSASTPGTNALVPQTPLSLADTPLPELPAATPPAPAKTAAKGKKAAAATGEKKKRAPSAKAAAKLATASRDLPLPEGVNTEGLTEEQLNALAIEEDKRRRNTAASARFRVKKKQREQALEQTAKELQERVAVLEKEVETLRTENGWLRGLIVDKTIDMGKDGASNNRKRAREDDEHADPSSILV